MIDGRAEKPFQQIRSILMIGLNTVERIGLKGVLESLAPASVLYVDSPSGVSVEDLSCDLIISRASLLATNVEFFLRRQGKVAFLTDDARSSDSPFFLVRDDLPETDFYDRWREILQQISPATSGKSELSAREIEVLREIAAGLTSKEIAEKLFISVNTVISHRKNLTAKLGIRSVSGLSLYAMMNGLL